MKDFLAIALSEWKFWYESLPETILSDYVLTYLFIYLFFTFFPDKKTTGNMPKGQKARNVPNKGQKSTKGNSKQPNTVSSDGLSMFAVSKYQILVVLIGKCSFITEIPYLLEKEPGALI